MSSERPGGSVPEPRTGPVGERVTTVISRTVRPGREGDFGQWVHGIIEASSVFPGHLSASVLHDPGSRDYHVLFQFTDRSRLDAWMESGERKEWLARLEGVIEAERGVQHTTGLETWFTLPGAGVPTMKPPPRWKMWLVSLAALYPLALLFLALVAPHVKGWPLVARAALLPFCLLTLMTYVVMPVVTRLAARWLRPAGGGSQGEP
ncbi:MAG: antibiotic biosynthesis monooxygenase [Actinomycetota bacterium]|nr:antibiotic biosynthesis monooxygenase [Actinomycetota bacterium]